MKSRTIFRELEYLLRNKRQFDSFNESNKKAFLELEAMFFVKFDKLGLSNFTCNNIFTVVESYLDNRSTTYENDAIRFIKTILGERV